MEVTEFNTEKGRYMFQLLDDFTSENHRHPVLEIILAEKGHFSIVNPIARYDYLKFAIIAPNKPHQLIAANCPLNMMMVEHHTQFIKNRLSHYKIELINGYYVQKSPEKSVELFEEIRQELSLLNEITDYEDRVRTVIRYIHEHELDYHAMMNTLQEVVHLSESRLSHLFKEQVGISLKKYLVWCKLRATIKQHLHHKENLIAALIDSGFYDQPHFSKAFKNMLGIAPSKAYK